MSCGVLPTKGMRNRTALKQGIRWTPEQGIRQEPTPTHATPNKGISLSIPSYQLGLLNKVVPGSVLYKPIPQIRLLMLDFILA
jgi:hypothetical protein